MNMRITATLIVTAVAGLSLAAPGQAYADNKSKVMDAFIRQTVKFGAPGCLGWVISKNEAGANPEAIGHDEDVGRTKSGYRLRNTHRLTYRGRRISRGAKVKNDDGLKRATGWIRYAVLSEYPNYRLDWRYSHGFGVGQVTFGMPFSCRIGGKQYTDCCKVIEPNGKSSLRPKCTINGKPEQGMFCNRGGKLIRGLWVRRVGCVTVPELLTIEGGVKAGASRLYGFWLLSRGRVGSNSKAFFASSCKRCWEQKRARDAERARGVKKPAITCEDPAVVAKESPYEHRLRWTLAGYAMGTAPRACRKSRYALSAIQCHRLGGTKYDRGTPSGGGGSGSVTPSTPQTPSTPSTPPAPSSSSSLWSKVKGAWSKFKSWVGSGVSKLVGLSTGDVGHITGSSVWMRSAASTKASRRMLIYRCREVKILGKKGRWIYIERKGKRGYVWYKYVRPGSSRYCGR